MLIALIVVMMLAMTSTLSALNSSIQPDWQAMRAEAAAQSLAVYRQAASDFVAANPAFSGTATDAQLTAYYPYGYTKNFGWTNSITAGSRLVFTTDPGIYSQPMMGAMIIKQSELSIKSGVANGGFLYSPKAGALNIVVPAAVPNGSPVWFF